MIGRVFAPGTSFSGTCEYVAEDLDRARVLYQEGVRGHDYRLAARDFEIVSSLRESISKPVFHAVLTFHRDEKLTDAMKVELGLKYLAGVGMENTQRLIVEHSDARHQHLHLVANRINYNGEAIHNFPEILRSRDTVEQLVREHGLVPVESKDLRQTNFDALDRSDTRRYTVYRSIKECLGEVKSVDALEERLRSEGIEMRYRLDEAGKRLGVSFHYQNEAFRGSEIDKGFSLPGLEKAIARRQELSQWEGQKLQLQKMQALEQEKALKHRQTLSEEKRQEKKLKREETQEPRLRQGPGLRIH
ncbi:MAG TPA: relaxase/mobilization nuclease domain-containing protein [Puia sp.]|nr:relaxase/mobilization nuclease domain-containing protein [Puia sp.]